MSTGDIIQNLRDAGCTLEDITGFMRCMETGALKKGMKLLDQQRRELLNGIHEGHRKLDCLDYLIYQLQKNKE